LIYNKKALLIKEEKIHLVFLVGQIRNPIQEIQSTKKSLRINYSFLISLQSYYPEFWKSFCFIFY